MSKESARLSRLGVLAPAALAACADASVLAVPAAGAIVSTLISELSKAFMLKKWFHGAMSAQEAEALLLEHGKSGSYLVRESRARAGALVLSVRERARVAHVDIHEEHNKYDVGSGEQFDDLVALIEHCRAYPLRDRRGGAGAALRLLQPVGARAAPARRALRPAGRPAREEAEDSQNRDGGYRVDREFQYIRMLERIHVFTTIEGNRPENISKNRYSNIIPYDQTRVVLRARARGAGGDYINASYVRAARDAGCARLAHSSNESLHSSQSLPPMDEILKTPVVSTSLSDDALTEIKQITILDKANGNVCKRTDKIYVATQGCLSSTKDDFWQMIWQDDIRVIAMITNEVENGKEKCERYWPSLGLRERHGQLVVRAAAEARGAGCVLRELHVSSDAGPSRTVYQYQFTTWPDHCTPAEPDGLLAFLEEVNKRMTKIMEDKNPPEHNILCVHCSAGVGRTGTFVVLDMLIDQIKSSGVVCASARVPAAVRLARAQRAGMVQSRAQYRFLYRALGAYAASLKVASQAPALFYKGSDMWIKSDFLNRYRRNKKGFPS